MRNNHPFRLTTSNQPLNNSTATKTYAQEKTDSENSVYHPTFKPIEGTQETNEIGDPVMRAAFKKSSTGNFNDKLKKRWIPYPTLIDQWST